MDVEQVAGPVVERFAASSGRVLGSVAAGVGLLLAGGVLLTDPTKDWGLLLFGVTMALLAYVVLIRPAVIAHQHGVVLRNMVRDTYVPWARIERVRVLQSLQVVTEQATYTGFGVTRSTRSMVKASRSRLRPPGAAGFGAGGLLARGFPVGDQSTQTGTSYQTYVESRVEELAGNARKRSEPGQPVVTWAPLPLAALVGAVACVVLMFLL